MPMHHCIDPHDQYSEAEVLVEFRRIAGAVRLISATDCSNRDILPDLEEIQQQDLRREICDAFREPPRICVHDGAS